MEFDFTVRIYAPKGMAELAPHLSKCRLKLDIFIPSNSSKPILRSTHTDEIVFNMEPSETDYLLAQGTINCDTDKARYLIGDLEIALVAGGFPHISEIKNDAINFNQGAAFMWHGQHDS